MADAPKSSIEAAISAIMKRDQKRPKPTKVPQLAELSELRRVHLERLKSEFTTAGLDLRKLKKQYEEDRKAADKLFQQLRPHEDSKPVELTESDRAWIDNKKRGYELISGKPLVTVPFVIDAPTAIYSIPSGSLIDSQIESWNSWALWKHNDSHSSSGFFFPDWKYAYIRFLFAWQNNTPDMAVIKHARADLTVRGQVQAIAHPPLLFDVNTDVNLNAHHRVFMGSTSRITDHHYIAGTVAYTEGWLMGGIGDFETVDINRVKPVIFEDIFVSSNQFVIFDVGLEAEYKIQNGEVHYVFTGQGRHVACPSLAIELGLIAQT